MDVDVGTLTVDVRTGDKSVIPEGDRPVPPYGTPPVGMCKGDRGQSSLMAQNIAMSGAAVLGHVQTHGWHTLAAL